MSKGLYNIYAGGFHQMVVIFLNPYEESRSSLIKIKGDFLSLGISASDIQRTLHPFRKVADNAFVTLHSEKLSIDRRPVTYSKEEEIGVFKDSGDTIGDLIIGIGFMVFEKFLTEQEKAVWLTHFPLDPESRFSASFYLFSMGGGLEDLTREEIAFLANLFRRLEIGLPE